MSVCTTKKSFQSKEKFKGSHEEKKDSESLFQMEVNSVEEMGEEESDEEFESFFPEFTCKTEYYSAVKTYSEVLPGLFISSVVTANNSNILKKLGVSKILNVSSECPNTFQGESWVTYMQIKIADTPYAAIAKYFSAAHKFISDALSKKEKVLVHCSKGVSRSCTMVISYIMKKFSKSLREAFLMCKSKRIVVLPNLGFMQALMIFEEDLKKENSNENVEDCTIDFFVYSVLWLRFFFPFLNKSEVREILRENEYNVNETVNAILEMGKKSISKNPKVV